MRKRATRQQIRKELRFYLEERTREFVAQGMDPEAAARAAKEAFGNLRRIEGEMMKEADLAAAMRERRGWVMGTWVSDMRMAFRGLRRNQGFTVGVILLLATGIAATTTVFAVVDAVVIRTLPYPDPEELIYLANPSHSPADFVIWESEMSSIQSWGGVWNDEADLTGEGPPDRVGLSHVTENYFELLGARAAQGRLFQPDEFGPDAEVVVVSDGYWRSRWGSDPGLLNREIRIGGRPMTVVGVLSPDFRPAGPSAGDPELWVPVDLEALVARGHGSYLLTIVGRLTEGLGLEAARDEMEVMAESLQERFPRFHTMRDGSTRQTLVLPLKEAVVGTASRTGTRLLAAAGFLLLIACANVANLFLARGTQRTREMALRRALGASHRNIVAQLGSESLLLSLTGGALGVAVALGGVYLFGVLDPGFLPRADSVEVNFRVMLFAVVLSLGTGLVFGILPAVQAAGGDPNSALKGDSAKSTESRRQRASRTGLVVGEIALSMMLLAGAGILFNSFLTLTRVDTGIESSNLVTVDLQLKSPYTAGERAQFLEGVMDRLRSTIPDLQAVAAAPMLPLQYANGGISGSGTRLQRNGAEVSMVLRQPVTPGYLAALGIPLIEGVGFRPGDEEIRPLPVVIDETVSRQLFGGESPLGQILEGLRNGVPTIIVGVAGNVRQSALDEEVTPIAYVPWGSFGPEEPALTLGIRTEASLDVVAPIVREAIWAQDPNLPIPELSTMDIRLARSVADERFLASLLAAFAIIAGVMAGGGLYGTLLYTVRQRHREMGIRMAVGAQAHDLLTMVLKEGTKVTLLGITLGLAGVWAGARVLESYVFGISPRDPGTIAAVTGLLATVALLACLVPALKAAATDPMETLRAE